MNESEYYNTTHLQGEELQQKESRVYSQEMTILNIFRAHPRLSPFELLDLYPDPKPPITSIRRGINNLTKQGRLTKTDRKSIGDYGALNYIWELNEGGQLGLFNRNK